MRIHKHLYTCLLALAAILMALSGCASNSSSTSSNGPKTDFGVDVASKTITMGILSPIAGPVGPPIGIPLARGVKVFFDHVNDNGGIDGYKVKFIEKDTLYDPQMEVTQYKSIRNQVLMIADSLGTPPTTAIIPFINQDHVLVSAATLASSLASQKYLILLGTPYRLQVENAFDYVVKQLGIQNPATGIIYQNDEYGQDGLTGYNEAVKAYGLHDVAQAAYGVTDTDFTSEVSQMKRAGAKYVFLTTLPTVTAGIVAKAFQLNYHPQWILQSPAFAQVLFTVAPALKALLSGAWVVSQGASWGDMSVKGMVQMLNDVKKYAPDQQPDGFFQAGYTISQITYAILKKALDNNDITRNGLLNAFESLKNVDLGGLLPPVTYGTSTNPNQRVPTRDNIVFVIDPTQPTDVKPLTMDFTGSAAMASNFGT